MCCILHNLKIRVNLWLITEIVCNQIFVSVAASNQRDRSVFTDQHRRRERSPIVMEHLGQRVSAAVEQRQNFSWSNIFRKPAIIRQTSFALDVEIDVT